MRNNPRRHEVRIRHGRERQSLPHRRSGLTPDSSRYWPADKYEIGRSQASYDKQYVRDYLESIGWNKQPPAPALPEEVVQNTIKCYSTALTKLMGE